MMRLKEIDFLRGIAVLLVLFRHFIHFDVPFLVKRMGWAGVDLFFVLSGFLVSGLLFAEFRKNQSVRSGLFLIRRGFKIYPLFYLMVAIELAKVVYFKLSAGVWTQAPSNILGEIFFLQNYWHHIFDHTWSLAVEEHFYFSLALAVFLLAKFKQLENMRLCMGLFVVVAVACFSMRLFNYLSYDDAQRLAVNLVSREFNRTHHFPTHLRIDSLLAGTALAYQYHFNRERTVAFFQTHKTVLSLVAVACLMPLFFFLEKTFYMNTFGLSLLYVGFGIVLMLFVTSKNTTQILVKIFSKPVCWLLTTIGFYSYSIYLWHIMVRDNLVHYIFHTLTHDRMHIVPHFIVYALACISIGILMSKLIETPCLKIRDKYFPRRT